MIVFKQAQIAQSTNNSARIKHKRAGQSGEDARDREHQHEGNRRGRQDQRGFDGA
ncbi:MAG TPA: hypothetical protein VGT44_15195 [Ktedonobacteraceae bacterium]|nr:hypothetical protein [Ktedonobacteraceae bacterium]